MKLTKMILAAVAILVIRATVFADTTTTRFGITKPTTGSTNWGTKWNTNADTIDANAETRSVVNVKDFGAVGDGVTDDLTAIQNAIAYATTTFRSCTVKFNGGTFGISNQILVPSNVTIQGSGMGVTTIFGLSSFPSGRDIIHLGPDDTHNYSDVGGGKYIKLRDFSIDAHNQPAGVGYGVAAFGVDYFTMDSVEISSTSAYGIIVQGSTTTYMKSPWITRCHFYNCGVNGGSDTIGGGTNSDARYTFNTFEKCNGTAIDNVQVSRALWMGNRSINNAAGKGSIWSDYGMQDSQIVDNYISTGTIHVYGVLTLGLLGSPSNVIIARNILESPGDSAILVSPANQVSTDTGKALGIIISNNIINDAYSYAINIGDAPGAIITGNQINRWARVDGSGVAIHLAGGVVPGICTSSATVYGNYGTYGNSGTWYKELLGASGQRFDNAVYGNSFPNGNYTLVGSTHNVITYPQGVARWIGVGSANTLIGGVRFGTDANDGRYAQIVGWEGGDSATIGLRWYTMNGDGNGIVYRGGINPDGTLESYYGFNSTGTFQIAGTYDGWVGANETWTYASANTFTVTGDVSTKYQAGMRVKLTQTTAKYFIITKVAGGGTTTITVYGGTDYTLANASITSPYYSSDKAPMGFNTDPAKWSETFTDVTSTTQASPAAGTWYNMGVSSLTIPIGAWRVYYEVNFDVTRGSAGDTDAFVSLSTNQSSASDSLFTTYSEFSSITRTNVFIHRERFLTLTASTPYYLIAKTGQSGTNSISFYGASANTIIKAVCAYL